MKKAYYKSPVGILEIEESDNHVTGLRIISVDSVPQSESTPLLEQVAKQLDEYFAGKRFDFDLPLKQQGTEFQQRAWTYLSSIPYGSTVSYKDEAVAINQPKACRAVGSANGKNNIAIIVPCHRVINVNSKLGGYAYGLPVKEYLLAMEKKFAKK